MPRLLRVTNGPPMPRTLYAKLAALLAVLFLAIGLIYGLLSRSATHHYLQEVSQRFNRDLARNLVAERNLVEEGRINQGALEETFHLYMVINPSIEIYLLDLDGNILSYSADPGKVRRRRVSLGPIRAFLRDRDEYPVLGDDPRGHDRQKAFSVTPVPSAEDPQGYLYVVLRGEELDAVDRAVRDESVLRVSAWAMAASLGLGLLAGLVVLRILTRRLHRLAVSMDAFDHNDLGHYRPYAGERAAAGDEIDRLAETFDRMARRIATQFEVLRHKDALRRELVAHVSHDLRTPLASLHGYLESLALRGADLSAPERAEYLAIALRHSERLGRLVGELFELARLDARETPLRREPLALAELVQDVVQKFRLRAEQGGLRLSAEPGPPAPFVSVDIALTERVLDNLIENAIAHTPAGGRVRVAVEPGKGWVRVRVSDTGGGIAEGDREHIFEPFYRAAGRTGESGHAGLGLAIARRIVELHRGRIEVSGEPGAGATLSFSLPVAGPRGPDDEGPPGPGS